VVWALNLRGDKILETVVERVFVNKGAGLAPLTQEVVLDYYKKYRPDELHDVPELKVPLVLDFENHWTALERSMAYETALRVGVTGQINGFQDLAGLACFLFLHALRSNSVMTSILEAAEADGISRFEFFKMFKEYLCDENAMGKFVGPVSFAKWTFYRNENPLFPIPDSPVLIDDFEIMAALSPYVMASVDLRQIGEGQKVRIYDHVPNHVLATYRRRSIANTFKEIVASEPGTLREWQSTKHYANRREMMKHFRSFNAVVVREGRAKRVLNAFGITSAWRRKLGI
jgi:hypothetical protein